jgi:uncharacterized OB-fold protein
MSTYDALDVPGPTETSLTRPFWEAAYDGRLLIQRCSDCGQPVFYPRAICPHCWSDRLKWEVASGEGHLASFSVVWKPGHPGWLPVVPYVVGLVSLSEGPTILSHILGPHDAMAVGGEVRFVPTKVGKRILPFFEVGTPA